MKQLLILALVSISMNASAKEQQVQASTAELPPVDYHVPTKAELIADFAQGFKSKLEHAQEYYGSNPELLKEETRLLTATPEDVEKVAAFTADSLQRQFEACQKLNAQYPKTQVQGVSCVSSVLMVNGLGHPDQHRQEMEVLADKAKAQKYKEGLDSADAKDQLKRALKTLRNGIDTKKKILDSSDVQQLESSLGLVALMTVTKENIAAALAK